MTANKNKRLKISNFSFSGMLSFDVFMDIPLYLCTRITGGKQFGPGLIGKADHEIPFPQLLVAASFKLREK
jgi:hypothetical protein